MKHFVFACLLVLTSLSAQAELTREWEDYSNPSIRSSSYQYSFAHLPLSGSPRDTQKLWASDYWPRKKGLINLRWNSRNPIGFKLVSPTKAEAMMMSQDQLATLAPSEKLDILNGDFDYSLVKEVDKIADKGAAIWHGICNGWSPASVNHNEPTPKTITSVDGIKVPFGSSDIKALISYYYAYHHEVASTRQMGKRCFLFGPGCDDDLNAGAFHIVITNELGLRGESMIADVERGRQVWNHAVNEYKTTVLEDNLAPGKDSAKGTYRRVRVQTDMTFVQAIKANSWYPTNGTPEHINGVRNYEYTLDLDINGRIIGGEWKSKARPDFIWGMDKATSFKGRFARLSELLND